MNRTVLSLVSVLVLGVASFAQAGAAVGEAAPDFTLTDVSGKEHSLSSLKGETVVLEQQQVTTYEEANSVITLEEGTTVSEVVEALNALGVSARDMIAIFQAIRSAGALHAEIVAL